jgi:hypothetical protein
VSSQASHRNVAARVTRHSQSSRAHGNRGINRSGSSSSGTTPSSHPEGARDVTTPEQRYVLGLAYQAGRDPNIQRGADGARDYFTAEELEKACWSFLPGGAEVGLFHADDTVGHFTVTESYIYRGPDWDQGNGSVIRKGDWLIGGICDDVAWDLVKSGRVTGFSPQGRARRRPAPRSTT